MRLIHLVTTMVFFRRRGSSLRPVNRIKHVVDIQGGIVLGVTQRDDLINTTDTPTLGVANTVQTGSIINGIYLKVEVYATSDGALSNVYMSVAKNPGNNLAIPTPNATGVSDNKRYVIHQEMVMLNRQINGNPRTLFNGVIAIPRGYRRFGPDDTLELALLAPGVNIDYCFQCHYKEFK